METEQQSQFSHNVVNILNNTKGVEIQDLRLFNLKNYKNISFTEIIIDFSKSNIKCPQGYLFKKDDYENETVKYILGVSNLYDLRLKLQIKTLDFDYFNLSRDIFLRKINRNKIDERIIINCSKTLLIGHEENNLENRLELKKKTDLSPAMFIGISNGERKRYARLYAYLNNNIKREYLPLSIS